MVKRDPLWVAWKVGRGSFGLWHRSYDPNHVWVTCGKRPSGIISTRVTPPQPGSECATCRQRDHLRVWEAEAKKARIW